MAYLTNLATIARRTGFPVVEEYGWRTRGHGGISTIQSVICHHDAANLPPDRFNTVIRDGHGGLPGPLAQFALRQDGTIHVVAAGLCYHAGSVIASGYNNSHAIGIEANNNGVGEPWPDVQRRAYVALCGELVKAFGLSSSSTRGHKEVAYPLGRKIDPYGISMSDFRSKVSVYISGGGSGGGTPPPPPPPVKDGFLMALSDEEQEAVAYRVGRIPVHFQDTVNAINAEVAAQANQNESKIDRIEGTLYNFKQDVDALKVKIDRVEGTLWDIKQLLSAAPPSDPAIGTNPTQ